MAPGDWRISRAKDALVSYFTRVFGLGEKLANMTLSHLLCADPENPTWVKVGQAMVAVDSLVHNFLHRTGILRFYRADHPYGQACSRLCSQVLEIIIRQLDARTFNPTYPKYFPRFVQHAIWRFCSVVVQDICNGVKIDDSKACERQDRCPVFTLCDRLALRPKPGEGGSLMIPLTQGQLDGLCGVYSTINATRLVEKLSQEQSIRLFHEICRLIEARKSLSGVLGKGLESKDIAYLFKNLVESQYSLNRFKPFHRVSRLSLDSYWREI